MSNPDSDISYPDLDVNLTEEEVAIRDMADRFGREVLRPVGIRLDRLADPQDVIAKDSELWDVHRAYRELMGDRRSMGLQPSVLGGILMSETFGYWDAGLALSLSIAGMPFGYCARSEDPELQSWARAFAEDKNAEMIGCWAITEPDHGSDWIMTGEPTSNNPKMAPQVKAVKKGKEYVISGQKSAWVSNGTIATHALLHVSVEPEKGMHGTAICVVPLGLPGIRKGKPLDKLGQRPLNQGGIFFDEVVIPESYMVVPDIETTTTRLSYGTWAGANSGMSVTFAGLAKAALDEAIHYAKHRVQGGKPIIEHQNVKLKLMKMFQQVEAARSLSRRLGNYNSHNTPGSLPHAVAAKALSTETAFVVASEAMQIHGGNGLSKEYVIEKLMRDARASMIEDGTNEVLLLRGGAFL